MTAWKSFAMAEFAAGRMSSKRWHWAQTHAASVADICILWQPAGRPALSEL
jgi:hypothetical protein